MRKLLLAIAMFAIISPASAQGGLPLGVTGDDAAALLREFGLTGTWSADCSRPEARDNGYTRFTMRDGRLYQIFTNDSTAENLYEILEAGRLGPDRLRVWVRFSNGAVGEIQVLEWVVRDGRVRTYGNISQQRGPVVIDGTIVGNKRETPWLTRCK